MFIIRVLDGAARQYVNQAKQRQLNTKIEVYTTDNPFK